MEFYVNIKYALLFNCEWLKTQNRLTALENVAVNRTTEAPLPSE